MKLALTMIFDNIHLPIPSEMEIHSIFTSMDVNGDGLFSLDEFLFFIKDMMEFEEKKTQEARNFFFSHNLDEIKTKFFIKSDD